MGYKSLSLVQVVFIALCAFSVLDYGMQTSNPIDFADGLFFNQFMFTPDGIVGDLLKDIDLWGMIQFWAYCFFIVAICQLFKALGSDK
ncbi:MAG: hypothetical protein ACW964_02545 [Candidatus Hodarchaeales archaeon]